MKFLRVGMLLIAFSSVGLWASAQSSGSGGTASTDGTNSASNSQSGASVNYTNNSVSTIPPMLLGSVPGVAGETIPGQAVQNGEWGGFDPAIYRCWTDPYMKAMSKGISKKFVHYQVAEKLSQSGRAVCLIPWWPETGSWDGDRVVATADVYGEPFHPVVPYLALALRILSEKSGSDRCAVARQTMDELLTINSARGLGAQASGTMQPGGNPTGMNAVLGLYHGKSTTGVVEYPHFRIVCLNEGSYDLPPSLRPKRAIVAPRPPTPPERPAPESPKPQPTPQPIIPPVTSRASECQAPSFLVLFDFDKSIVRPKYFGEIGAAVQWVASHPECTLEIRGNTDTVGTQGYNAALGLRRAKAVFDIMKAQGGEAVSQHVQVVSAGKEYPIPGNATASRRAILRVLTDPNSKH